MKPLLNPQSFYSIDLSIQCPIIWEVNVRIIEGLLLISLKILQTTIRMWSRGHSMVLISTSQVAYQTHNGAYVCIGLFVVYSNLNCPHIDRPSPPPIPLVYLTFNSLCIDLLVSPVVYPLHWEVNVRSIEGLSLICQS